MKAEAVDTLYPKRPFLTQTYQFQIPCFRVWKASLGYNHTIVMLLLDYKQQKYLIHCYSSKGQLLNETILPCQFFTFDMIAEDVLILHHKNGQIMFFSLKYYELKQLRNQDPVVTISKGKEIFVFPQTGLFCLIHQLVKQQKYFDDQIERFIQYQETILILEYFHFRGFDKKCQRILRAERQIEGNFFYFQRLDKFSKILWLSQDPEFSYENQLHTLQVDSENKWVSQIVSIGKLGNTLMLDPKIAWRPVCQLQHGIFITVTISKFNDKKRSESQCLKYSVFSLNNSEQFKDERSFQSQYCQTTKIYQRVIKKGDYAIIVTEHDNKHIEQPSGWLLSKLNCSTKQLQIQYFTQFDLKYQLNYTDVDWSDRCIIELSQIRSSKSNEIMNVTVRIIDVVTNIRAVYMFMLLHINEDFDDDMLQDAIELMTEQ